MSREAKISTEFEFYNLVRYNWANNQESLKNLKIDKKIAKNDGFLTIFQSFLVLGPILVHQTTKFELSG